MISNLTTFILCLLFVIKGTVTLFFQHNNIPLSLEIESLFYDGMWTILILNVLSNKKGDENDKDRRTCKCNE